MEHNDNENKAAGAPSGLSAKAMRDAIKEEREWIAAWIEQQRNDIPATGREFAAAIRAL